MHDPSNALRPLRRISATALQIPTTGFWDAQVAVTYTIKGEECVAVGLAEGSSPIRAVAMALRDAADDLLKQNPREY